MEINWHDLKKVKNLYQLTIEGSVYPQDIYYIVKGKANYDYMLITSYDLESDDFNELAKVFDNFGINYMILDAGIEVRKEWIHFVFEHTDFGESLDSFKLIQSVNVDSEDYDIIVDYRGIPDLIVKCKNKAYLEYILNKLEIKIEKLSE